MTKPEVTIIGGGIGGLTTALALQKVGIQCCIFEGAEAIKPVGAGIVMASNAMQIFKQLGIHQAIEAAGNKISCVQITDQELRTLSNTNLHKFENKYGVFNVAIHRADLQALIIREVGHENLFLSKKLVSVQQQEHAINLHFEDGSTHEASILIGADGINSAVRNGLFNAGGIRLANQKCWRGVCNMQLTGKQRHTATEVWGHGKRFGYVQINQQQVYWYAVVSHRLLEDSQPVQEYFHKFNPLCNNIINQTDGSTLFESEIHDLIPLQKWYTRNACLIGDAAHATTPNLGQGACQAVEAAS